jgi:hypothetical protein
MNIFILDENPRKAASYLYRRHLSKMQLETAQIFCTVCHRYGLAAPYRATHKHHPLVLWTGDSLQNAEWLIEHARGMNEIWTQTKKPHASYKVSEQTFSLLSNVLPDKGLLPVPIQKQHYRLGDAVRWYRNYYITEKSKVLVKGEKIVEFDL